MISTPTYVPFVYRYTSNSNIRSLQTQTCLRLDVISTCTIREVGGLCPEVVESNIRGQNSTSLTKSASLNHLASSIAFALL